MANFMGTGRDKLVRCTNEKCATNDPAKKAEPWIEPVTSYLVREPDEYDKYHRAMRWVVAWKCSVCGHLLPKKACPTDPGSVIGVKELEPR